VKKKLPENIISHILTAVILPC